MTPAPAAVVTLGETLALVEQSAPGVLRSGAHMTFRIGGAESNVAIGLARLDVSVCWTGRIGVDAFGEEIVRTLRGEGVHVQARRDEERHTGLMVKQRRTPDHQRITYYRAGSAGSALGPADLELAVIRAARVLHVTGITLAIGPSAAAALQYAVETAQDAGVLVSLDVNHRPSLWSEDTAASALSRLLPSVDILFAGLDEAALILGHTADAREAAQQLAARGVGEVVIKLGDQGAVAVAGNVEEAAPAVPVPVLDTVGAGDAFVAGYLAALLEHRPLSERLSRACAVGAFACTSLGDWEGAPTLADLELLTANEAVTR